MSTMKAIRIHEYGASDVLTYENAPRPVPGEGEILVRVLATTVNHIDVAIRSGYMTNYFDHTLPLILGVDVSGIVEELGPNTDSFSLGDEVYTRAGVTRDGSYAEFVLVNAADIAVKPQSLDHAHAAALPHVTLTAWQALFELGDLRKGQTVLIHGAAGGVGHVAVQLAKWRGANVIGTASQNIDFVESLGVQQAIDYSETAFEDAVQDVDMVLDTIGEDTQERSWSTLKRGGILVSMVEPPSEEIATQYGVRQAMVLTAPPIAETLTEVAELVNARQLQPVVSKVFPLEDVKNAHQLIEKRHARGKIALQVA